MSGHTPGWIADGMGGGFYFVMDASDTHVVATVPAPIHDIPWSKEQALAHRALIAAAPELLDGAKTALVWLQDMLQDIYEAHCLLNEDLTPRKETLDECAKDDVANLEDEIAKLQAAIAKATGAA